MGRVAKEPSKAMEKKKKDGIESFDFCGVERCDQGLCSESGWPL